MIKFYIANEITSLLRYNKSGHYSDKFVIEQMNQMLKHLKNNFYPFDFTNKSTHELIYTYGFGVWNGSLLLIPSYLWDFILIKK